MFLLPVPFWLSEGQVLWLKGRQSWEGAGEDQRGVHALPRPDLLSSRPLSPSWRDIFPWSHGTWTQHGQRITCQQDCISFYTPTQLFLPVQTTRQTPPLKSHPSLASQSWLRLFPHLECFLPPLFQLKETHNTAWMATLPWLVLRLQSCPPNLPLLSSWRDLWGSPTASGQSPFGLQLSGFKWPHPAHTPEPRQRLELAQDHLWAVAP